MGLEKILFTFWNGEGQVIDIVNKWSPKKYRTEKEYENSLYNVLHESFKEVQVTKQFSIGRIKADIVVGGHVLIELKNNLNSRGKYQRLLGQLEEYRDWDNYILLVLCGETDSNLKKELFKYINDRFAEFEISVIEKNYLKTKEQDKNNNIFWYLAACVIIYLLFLN